MRHWVEFVAVTRRSTKEEYGGGDSQRTSEKRRVDSEETTVTFDNFQRFLLQGAFNFCPAARGDYKAFSLACQELFQNIF